MKQLKMFIWVICYCIITLSLSHIAFSADKTVVVSTLYGYPPFCFVEGGKNQGISEMIEPGMDSKLFRGYSWDVFRESFHEMGYTIKLEVVPWSRAMFYLDRGTVDVLFPAGKNAERQKKYHYPEEDINNANFVVYVKKDSGITWNGLESLDGQKIGLMKGFSYGSEFDNLKSIKRFEVKDIIQGFKLLDKGRMDGFAGYEINWDYALKEADINSSQYKKLPKFGSSSEFLIGKKDNPKVLALLKTFDEGKRKITANGTFKSIQNKWR